MGVKAAGTPAGVQDLMPRRRPVVSSLKRSSTTGYCLRYLRHRFDQKVPFMTAKSINPIGIDFCHNPKQKIHPAAGGSKFCRVMNLAADFLEAT